MQAIKEGEMNEPKTAGVDWSKELECALDHARTERIDQVRKWGIQDHSPEKWHLILSEEVGELAQEMLNAPLGTSDKIRREAIQVAAVALAIFQANKTGTA